MVRFKRKKQNYTTLRQPKIYSAPKRKREFKLPKISYQNIRFIIWSVVIILAIYIVGFSPFFQVSDIMVEGNELLTDEQIISAVPVGSNTLFLSRKTLSDQIKTELPELKEVQVFKGIPNALKISVLEFNKALVWKTNEKYYLVSNQGQVYKDITSELADFPEIPVVEDLNNLEVHKSQKILSASFIAFVTNIYSSVEEKVNAEPDYFSVYETTVDVNLRLKSGIYVKFNSLRSSAKQMDDLKAVMVEKNPEVHEYIDLRVDGWAYYK